MIKFFRKIRQNLLSEDKRSEVLSEQNQSGALTERTAKRVGRMKYLKYAFGEIILVVIGILIAISINNWNEERKDKNSERQVLSSILTDLKSNEEILKKSGLEIDRQIIETKLFLELMEDKAIISDSTFYKVKKLLFHSSEVEDVQLNLSGIEDIINNKIELIANDSIKNAIIQYPAIFEGYKEQEAVMKDLKNNRIRPRVKHFIFLQNIAYDSKKFPSNIRGLLSDRTLANDLTDRQWESSEWKEDFEKLRNHGQDLIRLIEKELNQH